ncbi:MAG: prepilin-type N-terminal cleavage/methylation domain-containing protein [Opitutaceae bacterium]|nr:prepilin-type N-terminal cleavage/methylation domain-containing protein [Opitutaceae bacterium]
MKTISKSHFAKTTGTTTGRSRSRRTPELAAAEGDVSMRIGRPWKGHRWQRRDAGFTMIEAIVATVLLLFLVIGIFSGLMYAYRLSAHTRYRDHARYIIKSIGDEFLIQKAEASDGSLNPMFQPTTAATGTGLTWQGATGGSTGLNVTLGTSTGSLITDAVVTRSVTYLSSSGTAASTPPASTAGLLLRGDFRITYTYNGKPLEQNLSLVRRVP